MSAFNLISLLFVTLTCVAIYQYFRSFWFPKLPTTTGRYSCIGISYLRVSPCLRCKILYPADLDGVRRLKLPKFNYLSDPEIVISSFARVTNSGEWRIRHIQNSTAMWHLDAPLIPGNTKYPVILYSHGLGANFDVATAICSDLASHGKIVVCIEHADGSASCTRLGNGSVLGWDGHRARATPQESPLEPDSDEHVFAIRKFRAPQLERRVSELRKVLSHITSSAFEAEFGRVPSSETNTRGNDSHPSAPIILQLGKGPPVSIAPIKIPGKAPQPSFLSTINSPCTPPLISSLLMATNSDSTENGNLCAHSPHLHTRILSASSSSSSLSSSAIEAEEDVPQKDIYNHYLKLPHDLARRLDLNNTVLMGHSFGGATVLTVAGDADMKGSCGITAQDTGKKLTAKIRGVVAHDPWLQILPDQLLKTGLSIPSLTIFSEEFMNWEANMTNLKGLAGLSPQSVWMYIRGTKHWSFTDIIFWFEWFFVYFSGISGTSCRHKTLQKIRKLDADFVEEVIQTK